MSAYQDPIVTLSNVRNSFPFLFEPQPEKDLKKKPKFGVSFILDEKVNIKEIKALEEAVEYVKKNAPKLKGLKVKKNPIHEAEDKTTKEGNPVDGYSEGKKYITARNQTRPGTVDQKLQPLVAEDGKLYAGCYVNARVAVFGYNHPESGPGVTFSLINIQHLRDGEPFGAKSGPAEEGFTAIEEDEGSVV